MEDKVAPFKTVKFPVDIVLFPASPSPKVVATIAL